MHQHSVIRQCMPDSLDQLMEICGLFDAYGVDYWLDSGTLLGVCRDGHLLPSDSDIDIGIWYHSKNALAPVLEELVERGYSLSTRRYKRQVFAYKLAPSRAYQSALRSIDIKLFRTYGEFAWCPSVQARDISERNSYLRPLWHVLSGLAWRIWGYMPLTSSPRSWPWRHLVDTSCWWIPARYFGKTTRFNDCFSIPANVEDYLAYRYGEWRIPVADWDYRVNDPAYKLNMIPEELILVYANPD